MIVSLWGNAQENQFKNFTTMPSSEGVWIFPKNISEALELLKQDQLEKFVPADYLSGKRPEEWALDHRCMVRDKGGFLIRSEKIPEDIRQRFVRGMEERIASWPRFERQGKTICIDIEVIIDREGNILAPFFWVDSLVINLVSEEDLQRLSDLAKSGKIDASTVDFRHTRLADEKELDEKIMNYLKEKNSTIQEVAQAEPGLIDQWFKDMPTVEADYGVLDYAVVKRDWVAGLDYSAWRKSDRLALDGFEVWELHPEREVCYFFPSEFGQAYEQLKDALEGRFFQKREKSDISEFLSYWDGMAEVDWTSEDAAKTKDSLASVWEGMAPVSLSHRLAEKFKVRMDSLLAEKLKEVESTQEADSVRKIWRSFLRMPDYAYLRVRAIVNNKGEVLAPYFIMNIREANLVKSDELRSFCDALMGIKIDAGLLDFSEYTLTQREECQKQVEENPSLMYYDLLRKLEKQPTTIGTVPFVNLNLHE